MDSAQLKFYWNFGLLLWLASNGVKLQKSFQVHVDQSLPNTELKLHVQPFNHITTRIILSSTRISEFAKTDLNDWPLHRNQGLVGTKLRARAAQET